MKSLHCVYSGNRFADQYTLDLEGFMSPHEFTATINTFNTAAWHYPPPASFTGSANYYLICLATLILTAVIVAIHHTHQIGFLLTLPFTFLFSSMIIVYYRKRQKSKFESAMIHICSCMNATENVRGINYRLTFLTPEQQISTCPLSSYAITIEFDDRYNLLHHFSPNIPPSYSTIITIAPPLYDVDVAKPSNTYYPLKE